MGVEATVKNLNKFIRNMGIMQGAIGGVAAGITQFALNSAVQMTKAIVGLGKASVEEAVAFENSFAGIRKTVDTTEEDFQKLSDSMRELAKITPIDVNDLNKIAELGGQLGIVDGRVGDTTETLTKFTETIAALGVSTNLTTEAAATQLARFANIMQTTGDYGDETFSRLGSTIVQLGNNMATTESDILNFGLRVAGAGEIAGFSEADVLALGAAFSSVGVQANAGGTAVQKTIIGMNTAVITGGDNLEVFAAVAGMSAEEFSIAWDKDAGGAFQAFVNGLGKAGDDAVLVLEELGLKDQRLIRSFLSLANAQGVLDKAMMHANTGFEENTALMDEASKRYETTKSQWQLFQNTIKDVAIEFGSSLLPILNDLMTFSAPFINQFGSWLGEALPPLIQTATDFIRSSLLPTIMTLAEWLKVNVPIAIQILSDFWTGTLQPAISSVIGFINGQIIPLFNKLVAFFQQEGPGMIETFSAVWKEVWGFLQEQAGKFVTWFNENLPLIIETGKTIAEFWENNIVPALDNVWNIIKSVFSLFVDNILQSATLIMQIITGDWEGAWESIKTVFVNIWNSIVTVFTNLFEVILNLLGSNTEQFVTMWRTNWELLKTIVSTVWNNIVTSVTEFFNRIGETITTKSEGVKQTWAGIWESIKTIVSTVWENIVGTVTGIIENLKTAIYNIISELYSRMGLDLEEMRERWRAIWEDVKLIAAEIWERIKEFIVNTATEIGESLAAVWEAISTTATEIWEVLVETITEITTTLKDVVTGIIQDLSDFLTPIWFAISKIASEVWDEISRYVSEKAQEIYDWVVDKITDILTWFIDVKLKFVEAGRDLIQGLIDGALQMAGSLINSVTGLVEDAVAGAKKLLGIESPSKVFEAMGENSMAGFIRGITSLTPAVQTSMAMAMSPSVSAVPVVPTNNVTINMGGNNINSPMDAALFEANVLRVVTNNIG